MNHEFRQYRLARIEGYNITRTSLESRFHCGIDDVREFEKAIAEQLAALATSVAAWRTSEVEQLGYREGMRMAALEFYWEQREQVWASMRHGCVPGSFGAFGTGFLA